MYHKFPFKCLLFLSLFLICLKNSSAQKLSYNYGNTQISLNEAFSITIESEGQEIDDISAFPEIEGFKKIRDFITANSSNTFEGTSKTYYLMTKVYHPVREGTFEIPEFTLKVNGQSLELGGIKVKVGPYDESKGELIDWTYQDLFKEEDLPQLKNIGQEAFLGISIDKKEVFVGEGFNVLLALYIYENIQVKLSFWELDQQVEAIAQKIKPKNCWEENFDITELNEPLKVEINGKNYYQFVFYQASFFPLNTEAVLFEPVQMKLEVDRGEERPDSLPRLSNQFQVAYSNSAQVKVKELPEHPLRDKVVVGSYYLGESYPRGTQETGQNFNYEFRIIGEGNISAIQAPELFTRQEFEIYPPQTQQYVNRGQNRISGSKIFRYQIIPKEAGEYNLKNYFEWVYFNPNSRRYDTLRPQARLEVLGENMRNSEIYAINSSPYYQKIAETDNQIQARYSNGQEMIWMEIILFALIIMTLYLIMYHK